ncbi:MAG: hypothetical protein AAGF60_05745 [Pseudomonadota bacterium]
MAKPKTHKWKKGDKPATIAKKHGHRSFDTIWKDRANKALAAKRKTPEGLQPGDVVAIPLSPMEVDALSAEALVHQQTIRGETAMLKTYEAKRKRFERSIKRLQRAITDSNKMHASIVKEMQAHAKGAKRWGDGVDVAATLINLSRSLAKLTKIGYKSLAEAGEELAKSNKEAAKEAMNMAYNPIRDEAAKAIGKHLTKEKSNYNVVIQGVGVVINSFFKMTSPSFWGWTAVKLYEGKGWSEAVTYDFQAEVKNKIARLSALQKETVRGLQGTIAQKERMLYDLNVARNESLARIAGAKKDLRQLEEAL